MIVRRTISLIAIVCITINGGLSLTAHAQDAQAGEDSVPPLLKHMVGTWDVQQRMWPASGAEAITLPAARANRRLVGTTFLDEIMELAPGSKEQPFTRHAVFNYNAVIQQYEYFSIDTRGPQMMMEKTVEAGGQGTAKSAVKLYGESFVAPQWGNAKNVAFRYRLEVGPIEKDRQAVRLYFTPQ
jgi:uncharacterized protein DUF1579